MAHPRGVPFDQNGVEETTFLAFMLKDVIFNRLSISLLKEGLSCIMVTDVMVPGFPNSP